MPAKSDPPRGMAPEILLQGVPEAVVTPASQPPPIAGERPAEEYPDTDGKPMADNTWQATTMHYAGEALAVHFRGRAFVATDLLVYYRKGNQVTTVAPDVMVVLGVDGSHRSSYKLWEEGGRVPDFVLEVVSSTTQEKDAGTKRRTYARLGVREYFRYAPVSRWMAGMGGHRLVGEELREGRWKALPRLKRERIRSEVLGLELRLKVQRSGDNFRELRFFNPVSGQDLRTLDESERALGESERALDESERALDESERALDESERARREERQGRIRAERELAKLRARLEQAPGPGTRDAPSNGR